MGLLAPADYVPQVAAAVRETAIDPDESNRGACQGLICKQTCARTPWEERCCLKQFFLRMGLHEERVDHTVGQECSDVGRKGRKGPRIDRRPVPDRAVV